MLTLGHSGGGRHSRQNTYTKASAPSSRRKSTDRTTRLLIVILLMFLISEFPPVSHFKRILVHLLSG